MGGRGISASVEFRNLESCGCTSDPDVVTELVVFKGVCDGCKDRRFAASNSSRKIKYEL